ncbi:MAG TPA: hypothetical protein VI007_05840 [bacterium]
MNLTIAVLRLIHIFAGVFWVGTIWYFALFLLRRVKTFGQDTGRIMQTITAPPFPTYMAVAAILSPLSGIIMYWRDSAGFSRAWLATTPGIVLTIAAVLGIAAALEGLFESLPTTLRMARLGRAVAASGKPPAPAVMQEVQALSARLERVLYRMAYLMLLAVIGMATFRYL